MPRKTTARYRVIPLLAVSCALVLGGAVLYRNAKVAARDRGFEQISRLDTRDSVLELLGKPDDVGPCVEDLSWNGASYFKNDGQCAEAWSYAGGLLVRYEVSFDTRGMVIAKYPYVSE